jgi:hypothetical protein
MVNTPIMAHDIKNNLLTGILKDMADNPAAAANHIRPKAATGIPKNWE